ncbi:uncharacterized protein KRP23_6650 [Phytophthora ramorum]|uniref:uncharacterized protein n=1 Tax=Phytophthora ramorum TaxID=164328 RepID=UPI0030AE7F29|nr:hypothetical protein KRP23_6650 [Phytophthora ramorum]
MTYRELLATRVLSVDAYWEELRDPRRRLPNERDIPVPLWPGESVQQYEREFCRWLASQRLSLASMRENPVAERNCRLQFAQTRVARDVPVKKEFAPPEQLQRPKSPPATIAPPEHPHLFDGKNRTELLEKRIVPLDVFQKEVDQNLGVRSANATESNVLPVIPIPLHPGESMGLFDHRFWTWLKNYNETKDSLRGNPARERRFPSPAVGTQVSSAVEPREPPTLAGRAAAATSSRSSPSAERPAAAIVLATTNASTDAVENDGADTDTAQSEPDTPPAESALCEMPDTADDGEVHDGDVMKPDGCCCTKCMRSWATTLTDRMDQLEQNVHDLKREVVARTATTVE